MSMSKKVEYKYRNYHLEDPDDENSKIYHATSGGNAETINISRSKIRNVKVEGEKFLVYTGRSNVPFMILAGSKSEKNQLEKEWEDFM